MRWCCLQHVPFEGPGYLATWCQEQRFPLTRVELWKDLPLPAPEEFDGLFVLGGPMNVYEEAQYPWLRREKELIARAVSDCKPVLGVCLGAQLLSVVLGGTVTGMAEKEIGWFPVDLTSMGRGVDLFRGVPEKFMALHWHGDSFSIRPGAMHAAKSDACEQQAFVYEHHVVGLQFHLEASEHNIGALLKHGAENIGCGRYIQTPHAIEDGARYIPATQGLLSRLLKNLLSCPSEQCPSGVH